MLLRAWDFGRYVWSLGGWLLRRYLGKGMVWAFSPTPDNGLLFGLLVQGRSQELDTTQEIDHDRDMVLAE